MNLSEKEKGWRITISKQTLVAHARRITAHRPAVPESTSADPQSASVKRLKDCAWLNILKLKA